MSNIIYNVITQEGGINPNYAPGDDCIDDDCCGGGACNPCVWDHYYAELQKWRIAQAKINEQKQSESDS